MSTTTPPSRSVRPSPVSSPGDVRVRLDRAVEGAVEALFRKQRFDDGVFGSEGAKTGGHWCAELEGDSILITEYLLMKAILGQLEAPEASEDDRRRFQKMLVYLRRLQRDDGAWGQYPGSPPDVSATVKAYLVLKMFGEDRDAPHMVRAREAVLAMGGAEKINTFSNFFLACLGQVSWDACPSIPPEIVLAPRWFPFHLTKVAAWTRTMILPLALCTALRPVRTIPSHRGCAELFKDLSQRDVLTPATPDPDPLGWTNIFLGVDRLLKMLQKARLMPLRGLAITRAEKWILERVDPGTTDGLGAIFPPMVYIQIAFQALGYRRDHPVIVEAERQLDRFFVEEADHIRIQPCFSPVWDTGIALYALTEAGLGVEDERVAATCRWLLEREVRLEGDWHDNLRPEDRGLRMGRDIGAWAFEYLNDWYPDVDDTAMVAKALRRAIAGVGGGAESARTEVRGSEGGAGVSGLARDIDASIARAHRWIIAMQNDDGGWAAFDRTKHREWMEHVPFADHNAMQDPSCADITGRTIESLVTNGMSPDHPTIRRAVEYLRHEQHERGSWFGRWGVNHIYGTWQATGGLAAAGEDPGQPYLRRTLAWLRSIQNDDGGFGESANSYLDDGLIGRGPSTASQTAWGVCAMMFLLRPEEIRADAHVARAIEYLIETQLDTDHEADLANPFGDVRLGASDFGPGGSADDGDGSERHAHTPPGLKSGALKGVASATTGTHGANFIPEPAGAWTEPWFTGTGFPKVFYLRYHLYRHYFPLMALARYRNVMQR